MQRLMKSAPLQQDTRLRLEVEAFGVAKRDRLVAKANWEAKK